MTQTTRYPWDGHVKITVTPDTPGPFQVLLRVPTWTQGRPVPFDLYQYLHDKPETVKILVNGQSSGARAERGFIAVSRVWKKGDVIDLHLPMPIRRVWRTTPSAS